jgi:hypothetical protein
MKQDLVQDNGTIVLCIVAKIDAAFAMRWLSNLQSRILQRVPEEHRLLLAKICVG